MERIVSKTPYNRNDHKKYYKFHMFHRSKSFYFFIVVMLFFVGWTIYNTIIIQDVKDLKSLILSWALTIFTAFLVPLMIVYQVNSIVKRESKERLESIDIITVTKDKIQKNNSSSEGKVVIGWKQVESIYENKEFIYIYTGPQQGIFIKKADIIEGDVETFRKIAKDNMRKNSRGKVKYRIIYRENQNER